MWDGRLLLRQLSPPIDDWRVVAILADIGRASLVGRIPLGHTIGEDEKGTAKRAALMVGRPKTAN